MKIELESRLWKKMFYLIFLILFSRKVVLAQLSLSEKEQTRINKSGRCDVAADKNTPNSNSLVNFSIQTF